MEQSVSKSNKLNIFDNSEVFRNVYSKDIRNYDNISG